MRSLFPSQHLFRVGLALAILLSGLEQLPAHSVAFQDADPIPGSPPTTRGGGVRPGKCGGEAIRQEFYALTPPSNTLRTIAPHPTLYVYIPAIENKEARFRIIDDSEEIVYRRTFSFIHHPPGIFKIQVPEDVILKPDVIYQWGFFIRCNPEDELGIDDEAIEGLIQRLELPPPSSDRPLERADYYARKGIWQQAFEILLELRQSHPKEWLEFLESAELETYADYPIVN
ncbi:MAG: DUF928 domain-containing protein [Spirulina sp.]